MRISKRKIPDVTKETTGIKQFRGVDKSLINPKHIEILSNSRMIGNASNDMQILNICFNEIDYYLFKQRWCNGYYIADLDDVLTWYDLKKMKNRAKIPCPICNEEYEIRINNYDLLNMFCSKECSQSYKDKKKEHQKSIRLNQHRMIYKISKEVKLFINKSKLKFIRST